MDLDARIQATLAYAGLFGAGLRLDELRQRLFGAGELHPDDLTAALAASPAVIRDERGAWRLSGPVSTPPPAPVDDEIERVRGWAGFAGRLPFVRFIGLTGSLAKGSPGTDADLFVVAAAGRAYLAFAFLKSIGALAARARGIRICVNYVVDEHRLAIPIHDAFTATEFVTMIPLAGAAGAGRRLWDDNAGWVRRLCGSAEFWGAGRGSRMPAWLEVVIPGALDRLILRWKRDRFVRRRGPAALSWPDVAFESGLLKQHDASHRREILGRFRARLAELRIDDSWVEPSS